MKGRVGKGAASSVSRAMGQRPLTASQRSLLLEYRACETELRRARAVERAASDEADKVLALLRRTGMTIPRLTELTGPWGSGTKLRMAIERGDGLLGEATEDGAA